jgi:hypothetical protein
LRMRRSIR